MRPAGETAVVLSNNGGTISGLELLGTSLASSAFRPTGTFPVRESPIHHVVEKDSGRGGRVDISVADSVDHTRRNCL
jgi:hypothetical protein